jgi:dTDP-4-amino-4,6-dideoxygalactose transaminase
MRSIAIDTPPLPGTDELAAVNLALPISPVLDDAQAYAVVAAVAAATAR